MATNLLELRAEILDRAGKDAVKYDLGCGQQPEEGFIGVDYLSRKEGVLNYDLYSYPWPFADESVDYFRSSHFVEHVPDWNEHFRQVYRCLKPGGHYEIIAPFYRNDRWYQDPDHKQPILQARFCYLNVGWLKKQKLDHYGAGVNFDMVGWFELLNEDFRDQGYDSDFIRWHANHSFNVIDDVACILRKDVPPEGD